MIKLLKDLFSILEKHQKLGILKMQFIVFITAFTEVAGIASIGPFMSIVSDPSQMYQQGFFGSLYQFLNPESEQQFLIFVSMGVVTVLLVSAIVATFALRHIYHFAERVGAEIASNLFEFYMSSNWLFHTQNNSSKLITNITSECSRVTAGILVPILVMNAKIFISISILLFLFFIDPLVSLIGFSIFGIAYAILFWLVRVKLGINGLKLTREQNIRIKTMHEGFGGIKDILLMNRSKIFKANFRASSLIYGQAIGTQRTLSEIPKYWIELLAFGTMVLLVLFLMLTKNDFALILPTLSMFAMASYKLIPSFQQIYFHLSSIKFSQSALESISADLSLHLNKIKKLSRVSSPSTDSYEITLKNIYFQYPKKDQKAANDISITIPENNMIGFVGPSGSGKSTLIDIILGLLSPQSGTVKLGSLIIDSQNAFILQSLIGYVPQNIFLSDASIRSNIAFGKELEKIDNSKVSSACKQAQLDSFIKTLPDGLDTIVGEKGVQLSGGQKQRIAIARALYRNPKILVLDEATSSLDGITEKKIMESISKIASNITVLIIAHRLNTVKACDMIYYMDSGKIIDNGKYEELIISNMDFRDLSKIS